MNLRGLCQKAGSKRDGLWQPVIGVEPKRIERSLSSTPRSLKPQHFPETKQIQKTYPPKEVLGILKALAVQRFVLSQRAEVRWARWDDHQGFVFGMRHPFL